MPQNYTQDIGSYGSEIALDQVNSLVANNEACGNSVTNDSSFSADASNTGHADTGDASMGAMSTGVLTADASAAATIDAFTQSIVLGANIQSNAFNATIVGGNNATSIADSSMHSHEVSVTHGAAA